MGTASEAAEEGGEEVEAAFDVGDVWVEGEVHSTLSAAVE